MGDRNSAVYDLPSLVAALGRRTSDLDKRVTGVVDYLKNLGLDEIRARLLALEAIHPHQYPDCDCVGGGDTIINEALGLDRIIVASFQATDRWKEIADYQCDGVNDLEIIRQALSENPGQPIQFSTGGFILDNIAAATSFFVNAQFFGVGVPSLGSTIFWLQHKGVTLPSGQASVSFSNSYVRNIEFRDYTFGAPVPASDYTYMVSFNQCDVNSCIFWGPTEDVIPGIVATVQVQNGGHVSNIFFTRTSSKAGEYEIMVGDPDGVTVGYGGIVDGVTFDSNYMASRICFDNVRNATVTNVTGWGRDWDVDLSWYPITFQNGANHNLVSNLHGLNNRFVPIGTTPFDNLPLAVVYMAEGAGVGNRVDFDTVWWHDAENDVAIPPVAGTGAPLHAGGTLTGPTTSRPPGGSVAAGTQFFDTDTNSWLIWTGSQWIGSTSGAGPGAVGDAYGQGAEADTALGFGATITP